MLANIVQDFLQAGDHPSPYPERLYVWLTYDIWQIAIRRAATKRNSDTSHQSKTLQLKKNWSNGRRPSVIIFRPSNMILTQIQSSLSHPFGLTIVARSYDFCYIFSPKHSLALTCFHWRVCCLHGKWRKVHENAGNFKFYEFV